MDKKMELIAMDEDKEEMAVFRVDCGDDPNVYVWVRPDEAKPERRVSVADATEFVRYGNFNGSPLNMSGDFPREFELKALSYLEGEGKDLVSEGLERLNTKAERRKDEDIDDLKQRDNDIQNVIEDIRADYNGENVYNGLVLF